MSQRSGREGGVKPVGTKSQVYPKKLLDGSPKARSQEPNEEKIGRYTRVRGREAPRMDYLDVQLHFDDIVEDNRKLEALIDAEAGVTHVTYTEEEWRRKWSKGGDDESVG